MFYAGYKDGEDWDELIVENCTIWPIVLEVKGSLLNIFGIEIDSKFHERARTHRNVIMCIQT